MSVPVRLHYVEDASVVAAEFSCDGDPARLESGKRGWLAVSDEMDLLCGWRLRAHCSVTEPGRIYGYRKPPAGTNNYVFEDWYCGGMEVDKRKIVARFRIPDCFDPPEKKSFVWGRPILIEEKMFHCQLRLELRAREGGRLRRRAATHECAGGVEFVKSRSEGYAVIGFIRDSDDGRGREERISAYCRKRLSEALGEEPYKDSRGYMNQRAKSIWFAAQIEAGTWVDANPSPGAKIES